MSGDDFPALYRSADSLSFKSQKRFFGVLKLHLLMLVAAAVLSVVNIPHWGVATLQLLSLLAGLFCSIYLFSQRPDKLWYAGRAVAESVKTITWRYISKAEPFQQGDAEAKSVFRQKIRAIVEQNRDVCQSLTNFLDQAQITEVMSQMRSGSLEIRKKRYLTDRICDQLRWYANKAAANKRNSENFFWALIIVNVVAVICAAVRIRYVSTSFWPTDIFVAAAASLLTWMQAKRFSELAASYSLTAHEISLIKEQSVQVCSEDEFSKFVGDAENAFSREHTQWVARRDV